MDLTAKLRVIHSSDVPGRPGVTEGQTYQTLIGTGDQPTDRVRLGRATYVPHTLEKLHWHPIEALYYVIAGHAVVRDVEGHEFEVGPGSLVYAPAGIEGAHEWEVRESLELLDIRATNETGRKMQFTVDSETLVSSITLDELAKREGLSFPSHY